MAWVRGTGKEEQKEKQEQVATVSPYVQQRREKKNQLQKAFDSYEQANAENMDKYRREMQDYARKKSAAQKSVSKEGEEAVANALFGEKKYGRRQNIYEQPQITDKSPTKENARFLSLYDPKAYAESAGASPDKVGFGNMTPRRPEDKAKFEAAIGVEESRKKAVESRRKTVVQNMLGITPEQYEAYKNYDPAEDDRAIKNLTPSSAASGFTGLFQTEEQRMRAAGGDTTELEKRKAERESALQAQKEIQKLEKYLEYMELSYSPNFGYTSKFESKRKREPVVVTQGMAATPDNPYSTMEFVVQDSGYDSEGDLLYDYVNGDKKAEYVYDVRGIPTNDKARGFDKSFLLELTSDEIKVFNYLYQTEGEESAKEFLEFMKKELTKRQRERIEKETKEYAKENPVWASISSVLTSPTKAVSYIGQLEDLITTGEIDENAAYNKPVYTNNAIRSAVSENWGGVGSFLYNTGMSMADFLYTSLISGSFFTGGSEVAKSIANNLALAIMATEVAPAEVIEAKERGLSDAQAFTLGTIAGVAEIITEKYSLDALLDTSMLGKEGAKRYLEYIFKNSVVEGSEEIASSLINGIADILVSRDKNKWEQLMSYYMSEDPSLDREHAFLKALVDRAKEIGLEGLGGFISGGAMSFGRVVPNISSDIANKISLAVLKNYGIDIKSWVQFYKEAKAIETTAAESPATEDVTGEEETGETAEPAPSEGKKYVVVPVVNGQMTMDTEEYSTPQEAFAAIASKSGDGIEYAVIDMDTQEEVFPEGYDATQEKPTLDGPEAPEELKAETETVPSDTAETVATEEVTPQRKMEYATQEDTDAVMAEMTGGQGTTEDTDTVAEEAFKGEKDITPKEGWVAQNKNETMDEKTPRLNTLLARIQKAFDVNVSKGKVKQGALGTFSVRDEQVRIREANDVPTAMHEVGHYLDKKYGISKNEEVSQMLADAISRIRPGWSSQYKPEQLAGEAVAEFVRYYVTDKTNALSPKMFGKLGQSIIDSLGKQDLKMLNEIADAFNRYANSSLRERLDAAFGSASELQKELDALETVKDKAKRAGKGVMRIVDKNNDLKSVTSIPEENPKKITSAEDVNNVMFRNPAKKAANTYQRAMYTVHAAQIATRIVKGKWMVNSDGRIVTMKDVDGNEILDENGKPMQEKSLEGILAPLTDGVKSREQRIKIVKAFNALVIAERALAIQKYDTLKSIETGEDVALRRVAEPTIDNPEAMKQIRDEILAEHPEWQAIADDYSRWQRNLLRTWGLETGLITPELFAELGKYDFYAPLQRFHGSFGGREMKAKQSSQIVQRLRGSNEPIINPTDSTAANVQQMVSAALKNNVRKAAAQFATIEEGSANLLSRVPPDRVRTFIDAQTTIQNVQKQAEKAGVDPEEIDKLTAQLNEIITGVEKWGVKRNGLPENIMAVLVGGKERYYEVHSKALENALVTMTEPQMNVIVKAAKYLSNKFKTLTTGVNFIWALKNKVMDVRTAWYSSIEKNWLKFMAGEAKWTWDAIKGTFGKSDEYELYQQRGGGSSEYLGHQTKATEAIMREVFNTNKDGFVGFVRNIVETAGKMSEVIEQSTRYAEYQRYLQKGGKPMDAILAADEVTVNFNRGSKWLSEVDAFIPYSKSAFNGLYHDINLFTDPKNRKANIFRLAISNAVGASIEMLVGCLVAGGWDEWEKEYDKLSAWQRNNYYCFYVGKWFPGGFVKIPKSHLLSVPASLITTAATQVFGEGNERDRADEMQKFGTYLLDQISPFNLDNPFGSMIGVSTGLGLAGNQTFSGGKIVPDSYKGPKREQYNDNTSWLAYELGQLFGWSPMKIDYVLSQNFGILADISSTVKVNGLSGKSVESLFRNTWYADNAYSTDRVNRLYDDKEDADTQAKSIYATDEDKYRADAFDAVTTVVGQMIKASRGTETERDAKLKAGDIADEFRSGIGKATLELAGDISDSFVEGDRTRDKNIVSLASRTGTNIKDLAPYDPLYSTFSIGKGDSKRTYTVDGLTLGSMWMDYVSGINDAYDGIFATEGISDEDAVTAMKKAKDLVKEAVKAKYALVSEGVIKEDAPIETNEFGLTTSTYAYIMAVGKRVKEDADKDKKKTEVAAFVDSLDVSNESKYMLMEAFGYTSPKGTNSADAQYDWVSDWWDYYYEQKRNKGDE